MYLYPPKKIPRTYEVGSLESLFFYVYMIFAFPLTGKKFYPPWRDHPDGDPVWGPNLISFSFIVHPEKSFLISKTQ